MASAEARCPNHPDVPALGNCQRCGTFFCAEDRLDVDRVAYCRPCGLRPDIDWIEGYRQSRLGKRDSWAWFLGFSAFGYLVVAANLAATQQGALRLLAIPAVGSAIVGALFFFGKPVARILLVVSVVVWSVIQVALVGPWALVGAAFSGAFVATALTTTRNRLFFRLEVSRQSLKQDYQRLADNRLARNAFAIGVLSLLLPVFAPVAIVCGVFAVRAVDPRARPPIGKMGYAIAGIVFGVAGTLLGMLWIQFALAQWH